jgi:NAD(P)-dependent dehydrogenase (short-subunit alcohol dehydrogenase family)
VSSQRLAGQVALITGAGSGLGRASALRFAAEGAAVACADRDESAVTQVVGEVTNTGGSALAVRVDVSSAAEAAALAVFLASDEAKWITGGIYPVDGGRSAG